MAIVLLGILLVLEGIDLIHPFMGSFVLGILMIVVGAAILFEKKGVWLK